MDDWEDSLEQAEVVDLPEEDDKKKPRFSFLKLVSILLLSIIVLASLYGLCDAFGFNPITFVSDTIYKLKPYSVLDFEKLETPRPRGTICSIECNEYKKVNPGIVYHDSQIDIYESLRFDKLIKTINLPGKVEQVKCMYKSIYDKFNLANIGFEIGDNAGLVLAIIYEREGKRILRRMHIPGDRIIHWNYMTGSKRDRSQENFWLLMAEYAENGKRQDKNLPDVKLEIDEHPKNPFEYLETDYWMELKDRNLFAIDPYFTYLTSNDGKIVYRINSDKFIQKYYSAGKPAIWSYYYGFMARIDIIGYDGRYYYKQSDSSNDLDKFDTHVDGDLSKSFFYTYTGDQNGYGLICYIWNGNRLINLDDVFNKPLLDKEKPPLPTSIVFSFINLSDETCNHLSQYFGESFSNNYPFKAISAYSVPFKNELIWDFEMIFALDRSNNPVILATSQYQFKQTLLCYKTKNINEPVTDFFATVEDGRPVFYLINDKSIYRWENSTDSMGNLKPEILNLDTSR